MDEVTLSFIKERLDRIEDKVDHLIDSHQFFRGKIVGATLILPNLLFLNQKRIK